MKNIRSLVKHRDAALSITVLLVALLFVIQSLDFDYPSNVFPWTMEAVIVIFALIILLKPERTEKAEEESGNWAKITGVCLGTVLYLIIMPVIGFYVTSFLFITFASWILGKHFSLKRLGESCLASGAILFFIYLIFHIVIRVPVPSGVMF